MIKSSSEIVSTAISSYTTFTFFKTSVVGIKPNLGSLGSSTSSSNT
jgi:hypothetical protein